MKIFIVPSESPFKVRKMAVYGSLRSFLVPELLSFKILESDWKKRYKKLQVLVESIKIDKICDIMWWTSDSKQSLSMKYRCKYLFKSFETLQSETKRHFTEDVWKIGCHSNDASPRPLQLRWSKTAYDVTISPES